MLVFSLSDNIGFGIKGWAGVLVHCSAGWMVLKLQQEHMMVEIPAVCSVLVAVDMVL